MANFARLFHFEANAIPAIKRRLPKYPNGSLEMVSKKERFELTDDDVEETKKHIRHFHQDEEEEKILFVFRPFKKRGRRHGFILITDPRVADKALLRLIVHATQTYELNLWGNCTIRANEQMLAPSEGVYYHIPLMDVLYLFDKIVPHDSPTRQWTEIERQAKLRAISKLATNKLSPLPELFEAKGWRFEHSGHCATLQLVDYQNAKPKNLKPCVKINLMKKVSVKLYRLVNLDFFAKFRAQSGNALFNNDPVLESANPSVIHETRLIACKSLAETLTAAKEGVSNPQKLTNPPTTRLPTIVPTETSTSTPKLSSEIGTGSDKGSDTGSDTGTGSGNSDKVPPLKTVSSDNDDIESIDSFTSKKKSKINKMVTKISGENFSVLFDHGQREVKVVQKSIKNIADTNFAQNILELLEMGFQNSQKKNKAKVQTIPKSKHFDEVAIESNDSSSDVEMTNIYVEPITSTDSTIELQTKSKRENQTESVTTISEKRKNENEIPSCSATSPETKRHKRKHKSEIEVPTVKIKLEPEDNSKVVIKEEPTEMETSRSSQSKRK